MGSEQSKRLNFRGNTGLSDDVSRSLSGFPNSFTPHSWLSSQFYDLVPNKKNKSLLAYFDYVMNSPDETPIKRLMRYLKCFVIGGLIGFSCQSANEFYSDMQYFPFRKLEQHIGAGKRLSMYPMKYVYITSKSMFIKSGLILCGFFFIYDLLAYTLFIGLISLETIIRGEEVCLLIIGLH